MIDPDLVLEFNLEDGRNPDIEKVARALLAWNDAVQTAIRVIDPRIEIVVELSGVEHGSQRFKQTLRFLEDIATQIDEGGKEYPLIFKHAKALAKLIAGGILMAWVLGQAIPDEQLEELEEIRKLLEEDAEFQRDSEEFFETLQEEPSITEVQVYEGNASKPTYSVPRSEFAHKSGFFKLSGNDIVELEDEERIATWDVVLIRPVLVGKPRRWTFARDGVEFSATMNDQTVLEAIKDKSASIPFAEGVLMRIELTYREEFDGSIWRAIPKSRSVRRVLSPRITLPPGALFTETY